MCYAIPAKVIAIQDKTCVVDYFGEHKTVLLDLDGVDVGDYIYAQGGISVRKIANEAADSILQTWREIFFELKKTDAAIAKIEKNKITANALAVLQKINLRKTLTKKEMLTLLQLSEPNELQVLYEIANNVRKREHGNASCVHGILEFSNYCHNDCYYCGIRQERDIRRYRMQPEEIVVAAYEAVNKYGFKALVLQSGEDLWYDTKKLIPIIKAIRAMGVLVFLSIGMRDAATYQSLYDAGARAALLRFETANALTFSKLRPKTNLAERITLIKQLKKFGFIIATGFIVGLPDETLQDVVNNIALTKYLAPDMYSFGPLIPSQGTPLAEHKKITKDEMLKIIAVTRFVAPDSNILVTTALETLTVNSKKDALLAGANSLMLNITPQKYRSLYTIYDGKTSGLELAAGIKNTIDLLYQLGRAPTDIGVGR